MSHESYDRAEHIEGSSNRSFGLVFTAFFTLIGLLPLIASRGPRWWSVAIAALFLVLALLTPALLAPLNRLWMNLGVLLGRIVSPIALGVVFFLVVTPIGLFMRLLGKDFLRLRLDGSSPSYWIDRRPPGPAADTLRDQF